MKNLMIATILTLTTGTAAVANPFFPESQTFNFQVSGENPVTDTSNRPTVRIPFSLPDTASAWDKMTFCSNLSSENQYDTVFDKTGNAIKYGPLFTGTAPECFLQMPSIMNDGEFKIDVKYKGTTKTYEIVYRDVDNIDIIHRKYMGSPDIPLLSEYEINDPIYLIIKKRYTNLYIEGSENLPFGISLTPVKLDNVDNSYFVLSGKFEEAGNVNLKITDLNNDNKEATVSFKINPKPEPEPEEEEQVAGCTPSTPKNGEKIIFRYSMNRVDTKC